MCEALYQPGHRYHFAQTIPEQKRRSVRRIMYLLVSLFVLIVIVSVILLPKFFGQPSTQVAIRTGPTAMFGLDAAHTHANPVEHILIPSTVPHLVAGWSSFPTAGSLFSS